METKRVICYIQAYDNAETVGAAIRSVQAQTYENWLCFVLSNGNKSTRSAPDYTLDAIKSAAGQDKRFVILNKRENNISISHGMLPRLAKIFPDSYICLLDADDEYEPDFFQRAVAFAEEKKLDIVACGIRFLQKEKAGDSEAVLLRTKELPEDRVFRKEQFTEEFPTYKTFFNALWGKLYRAHVLTEKGAGYYVDDTVNVIHSLSRSEAIGILSGAGYKYYQYKIRKPTCGTNTANIVRQQRRFTRSRIFSVYATYGVMMDFLRSHGTVSTEVYEYMQAVLFGWFGDFYNRVLTLQDDERAMAGYAYDLVFHEKFDELMAYRGSGAYNNLRGYQERLDFCRRLRYLLLCQESVRNRQLLWVKGLRCSAGTARKLRKTVEKLDITIRALSQRQEQEVRE